jgi:hypothetical protein
MHRFYFMIQDSSVFDCIHADSFIEAKAIAHREYGSIFNRIQWVSRPGEFAAAEAFSLAEVK